MYLKKTPHTNGRIRLSIVDNYYDKEKKSSRQKTIESLGFLDELEAKYDNPIEFFEKRVAQLNEEKKQQQSPIIMEFSHLDRLSQSCSPQNFGYLALSDIYHELDIHKFLTNRQRHTKEEYDADTIMKMLVFSRLLAPASKKKSYENRNYFFEKDNYSLDDVYRSLSFFNKHKEKLKLWINDKIKENYGRDTSLVYYDVTNYYFETEKIEDFRKKGVSKEHRPNPIVQMGLFMDNNGLPITYQLFPGNTNDCLTYRPNLSSMKKDYGLGKVVVVADKGMTTGDNIWYTLSAGDGYVFIMSVRGANIELKNYVLDQDGYEAIGEEYKRKSRLYPREIKVTGTSGKKLTKKIDEKQVVFYSEKYAKRAKAERAATLDKALDFEKETGEIITKSSLLEIDEDKIREDEALDGYYVLATSECEESDDKIIEMYRGLWKIEESFRVTKSDLEARPVYVSRQEHIEAHFLTCFVSLVIARILEMKTGHKYSIGKLLESLRKCECSHVQQNYYLFTYYDEVLMHIGEKFKLDFGKKIRSLGEIKNILATTKMGNNAMIF